MYIVHGEEYVTYWWGYNRYTYIAGVYIEGEENNENNQLTIDITWKDKYKLERRFYCVLYNNIFLGQKD